MSKVVVECSQNPRRTEVTTSSVFPRTKGAMTHEMSAYVRDRALRGIRVSTAMFLRYFLEPIDSYFCTTVTLIQAASRVGLFCAWWLEHTRWIEPHFLSDSYM